MLLNSNPVLILYLSWLSRASGATQFDKFKILPLSGLHICVSGLALDLRESLKQLVEQHGATYHKDLTKSITHLLVTREDLERFSGPEAAEGPLKVQYARKWNIPILPVDWIYKSIQAGMLLDPTPNRNPT